MLGVRPPTPPPPPSPEPATGAEASDVEVLSDEDVDARWAAEAAADGTAGDYSPAFKASTAFGGDGSSSGGEAAKSTGGMTVSGVLFRQYFCRALVGRGMPRVSVPLFYSGGGGDGSGSQCDSPVMGYHLISPFVRQAMWGAERGYPVDDVPSSFFTRLWGQPGSGCAVCRSE